MKKLNHRGFTHVLILSAFVAIFAVSGVAYLVGSHADSICSSTSTQSVNGQPPVTVSSSSCNSSTCLVNGVQQATCPTPKIPTYTKPVIPKIPTPRIPRPTIPTPVIPRPTTPPVAPAPTPTPPANINHPTAATCLPNGKHFTVYASVAAGTPAYSYSGTSVLRNVPYRTAIESVYCNDNGTLLYHYDGSNVYSTYHLQDVSTTLP